ncbi:MAG: hemolysin family protein [Methylophilaceae bacterium]
MGSNLLLIVFAFFLVLLNGFFVAAEFGLVKLRQTRVRAIAKAFGWRGRMLAQVHRSLDAYLSACQLGITLASLGLGWVGEPAFAQLIEPLLSQLGIDNEKMLHGISFFVAFFTISYLHIVVGELVPKTLAIRAAEKIGLWTAPPLYIFYWVMYPAIWILNQSSNLVLRALHLQSINPQESHYSTDELKMILRSSRADDKFSQAEWRVLAQAMDFRDLDVSDLMRPFHEAVVLHEQDTLEENISRITQHRYSRYPYLDKSGEVLGMIHMKDIFIASQKGNLGEHLDDLVRPIEIVSPDLRATELFRRFQQGAPHITVVGYEGNPPVGFITLDNLLGALVGEIRDEFRQSQSEWTRLDDGSLLGKGSLPIPTLGRTLGIDIESDTADTIAGLILWKLGDLPEEGQKIEFEQFAIVVKKMTGPRILLVRVYPTISADTSINH